jgi:hypothetical protein
MLGKALVSELGTKTVVVLRVGTESVEEVAVDDINGGGAGVVALGSVLGREVDFVRAWSRSRSSEKDWEGGSSLGRLEEGLMIGEASTSAVAL